MATHSSVLAWKIPGTGEPGGLPSLGSHRVGHDWSDLAAAAVLFSCFPGGLQCGRPGFNPWVGKICRRAWQPTSVFLPGKSHGWRSLVGYYSPWGRKESDTTERLHFDFSLSWTGEGNGNPLQYSCLENPRDGGAWWAAIYGVAQSRTWLKRLGSSSSSILFSRVVHQFTSPPTM